MAGCIFILKTLNHLKPTKRRLPMLMEKIASPADVKKMDTETLKALAGEIRTALLNKISKCGGHLAPNLGFVEPTIALHYVFESPKDKIVYDVSHQSYTHKILTGRAEAFLNRVILQL